MLATGIHQIPVRNVPILLQNKRYALHTHIKPLLRFYCSVIGAPKNIVPLVLCERAIEIHFLQIGFKIFFFEIYCVLVFVFVEDRLRHLRRKKIHDAMEIKTTARIVA